MLTQSQERTMRLIKRNYVKDMAEKAARIRALEAVVAVMEQETAMETAVVDDDETVMDTAETELGRLMAETVETPAACPWPFRCPTPPYPPTNEEEEEAVRKWRAIHQPELKWHIAARTRSVRHCVVEFPTLAPTIEDVTATTLFRIASVTSYDFRLIEEFNLFHCPVYIEVIDQYPLTRHISVETMWYEKHLSLARPCFARTGVFVRVHNSAPKFSWRCATFFEWVFNILRERNEAGEFACTIRIGFPDWETSASFASEMAAPLFRLFGGGAFFVLTSPNRPNINLFEY